MVLTVSLLGGLGNLMFQTAAIHSLAIDSGDDVVCDSSNVVKIHNHLDTYKTNILRNVSYGPTITNTQYNEPYFHYNKIPYSEGLGISGYFQSEKYFQHNREKILDLFSVDDVNGEYINKKYCNVLRNDTCSIHIRRGDYLGLSHIHPPCSLDYYLEAIKQLPEGTVFLVFSDDLDWCKENLNFSHLIHFVEGNTDYQDMWLMSLCDNNIIANSSFSWWGAWLNQNPNKKVIAPKVWFGPSVQHNTQDLIPETWITI
jgi:hypothetical protein